MPGDHLRYLRKGVSEKGPLMHIKCTHSRACTRYDPSPPSAHHVVVVPGPTRLQPSRGPNVKVIQPHPATPSNRSCVPYSWPIIHLISASKLPWRRLPSLGRLRLSPRWSANSAVCSRPVHEIGHSGVRLKPVFLEVEQVEIAERVDKENKEGQSTKV
jgi:hypothetical protein